jgi:hypothetical protein
MWLNQVYQLILIFNLFKMREIKMLFNGKTEIFQVTYECLQYVFCECKSNPSARGFFSRVYLNKNQQ